MSKDFLSEEAIYKEHKIQEIEEKVNKYDLLYKSGNKKKDKTFDFQKFKTRKFFGRENFSGIITPDDALEEQINLKDEIDKESTKPNKQEKKSTNF